MQIHFEMKWSLLWPSGITDPPEEEVLGELSGVGEGRDVFVPPHLC